MEFTYNFYQHYWWFVISLIAAALVFLLFVQGGQTLLSAVAKKPIEKSMAINALGRTWELTFTTLVVFGGGFFASFPLFYSTSFGGAYWLWMAILFSFIIQAVSYEYRSKKGNFLGTRIYELFLKINGFAGLLLLGVAVGTFFSGAPFRVDKNNIYDLSMPVISTWQNPWHGLELIFNYRNLLLGLVIFFLARVQGALYFMNTIDDSVIFNRCRKIVWTNGIVFVVLFLAFVAITLLADGYQVDAATGFVSVRAYKYFYNLVEMPWVALMFVVGVIAVLFAILKTTLSLYWKKGLWFCGVGTILVVLSLFFIAGYNHTSYYPSTTDMQSSLTLYNSSSSYFTLRVMSIVSLLLPIVFIYIVYAWRSINSRPITEQEMKNSDHSY